MYNRWNGRNTEGGCTIDGTAEIRIRHTPPTITNSRRRSTKTVTQNNRGTFLVAFGGVLVASRMYVCINIRTFIMLRTSI